MQPSREPRVSFRWRRVRSPAPAIMPVRILSRCAPRVKPSSPRKAMPKHSETRHLPYSPEQMFDLVSDVKRYPEFLPWVTAVRVRSNNDAEMVADLVVGFKALRESFTSRVHKSSPDVSQEERRVGKEGVSTSN